MTEERAIVTIPPAAMPALTIEQALARRDQQREFIGRVLVKDQDYGEIPGTKKDTLLKPGAEKLLMFFGLRPRFEAIQTVEDWTGKDYGGEPFFYYHQKCILYRDGETMAEGDGSCNSRESKYRYRKGERSCPSCGQATIIKGKAEYGGGWLCYKNKGGCGAKYKDGDQTIEGQQAGRVLNTDVADQANTILKMAQKRALVAATLIGVNASEYFTQDMEDLPRGEATDAEYRDVTDEVKAEEKKTTTSATKPAQKAADLRREINESLNASQEMIREAAQKAASAQPAPLNDWIANKDTRMAFWAQAKSIGYTEDGVYQALGVTSMRFFKGTYADAVDALMQAKRPSVLPPFSGEDVEQEELL